MDKILLFAGCAIFVLLGGAHLAYTFLSNKFDARDASVTIAMTVTSPVLTRRTTMWKAWVGFNASHSIGAMLFGAIFMVIAAENYAYLRASIALNAILLLLPGAYLALAFRYWFKTPRNGIMLAWLLIAASFVLR